MENLGENMAIAVVYCWRCWEDKVFAGNDESYSVNAVDRSDELT